MKMSHSLAPVSLCLTLSLFGCKPHAATPAAPPSSAQAASAPAPGATEGGAAAPAKAGSAAPAAPFDFGTIADSGAKVPPFPYIDYPPAVGEAFQSTQSVPFDEVRVILGKRYYPVQGRVAVRTFSNSDAKMSELEVRRNYEGALANLGAVKVNTIGPDDPALVVDNGDDSSARDDKLRIPEAGLSYATYLIRKGSAHHWIVLMVNERTTRLIAIDEQPFAQTVGYEAGGGKTSPVTASGAPAAAAEPVAPAGIPVSATPLPPFPYLAYPPTVGAAFQTTEKNNFDRVHVIVGKQLQAVEGKLEIRTFFNSDAKMSTLDLRRNYEAAVKGLGGVKVNTVAPEDAALIAASGGDETDLRDKKLRLLERGMSYDSYLVRTADKQAWIVLSFSDSKTRLMVVEEKAFAQSVPLVNADTMRDKLAAEGHIALYVNFDTDRATLRADGKPTVAEIAALLKKDPALKLAIEGHTDNVGDAARNKDLSQRRAEAVVAALVAAGIDQARLRASGLGDSRPLAKNDSEQGRARNRRVELVKLP